jgi:hypothetical protein
MVKEKIAKYTKEAIAKVRRFLNIGRGGNKNPSRFKP